MTLDQAIHECTGLQVDYALAAGCHAEAEALIHDDRTTARSARTRARYDDAHRALMAALNRLRDIPGGAYFANEIQLKAHANAQTSQRIATLRALASFREPVAA